MKPGSGNGIEKEGERAPREKARRSPCEVYLALPQGEQGEQQPVGPFLAEHKPSSFPFQPLWGLAVGAWEVGQRICA